MALPKLLLFVAAYWSHVSAVPAATTPAPSITLYAVDPPLPFSGSPTPITSGFTNEITASVVGVSTDSAGGTETTYSVGLYFSLESRLSVTENYTIVESSAGEWMTFAPFVHGNTIGEGSFQSCIFAPDGGPSASCVEVDYEPTGPNPATTALATSTRTYEGSKVPLTFSCPNLQMGSCYILFLFGMALVVG
ncbi:hypothetical protein BDP27DRAFT_1314348 [Rhodocollybia butyracea]|uniref:Uncharacterized protein n=1 Tax=Rhodocollybia butyracea TaxID=206335 RepID=A0A9P5Q5A2_9AGAR|nr:hypothetical protein BDP27DRAFT_1314348 [Rhodocollybia butyracea]